MNLYAYVGGGVLGSTDPSGLAAAVVVVGGVVISAAAAQAIAASFGFLTITACMLDPACSKALRDAANEVAQGLDSLKETVKDLVRWTKDCRLRCKLSVHPPHHYFLTPTTTFPFIKKCWKNHFQLNCWLKGVPFSRFEFRKSFGPCCKFLNCKGGIIH